ncbi:hypothetical protein BDN67DRAFT_973102, partial [Paxillus ammoniavirescens]
DFFSVSYNMPKRSPGRSTNDTCLLVQLKPANDTFPWCLHPLTIYVNSGSLGLIPVILCVRTSRTIMLHPRRSRITEGVNWYLVNMVKDRSMIVLTGQGDADHWLLSGPWRSRWSLVPQSP